MSRRLIIGILILLIIGIIGGTVAFVAQRLGSGQAPVSEDTGQAGNLDPAQEGRPTIVNPESDPDSDGLTNAEEAIWGTNPNNPDTDGDGYRDGAEVIAHHNPTIPAPNDKLPEGFSPGRDLEPLNAAPLQVDQFFAEGLDLTGGRVNLTEEYNQQYAEAERTPDTLRTYVATKPIITRLSAPRSETIVVQASDTPLVMAEYLDVAGDLSVFSAKLAIGKAIDELYRNGNPGLIRAQAEVVRLHQENLLRIAVPPAAANLQKLLLGYTELVAATYELMGKYNDDPVKAVLALRQLETIDQQYIPLINQELIRLEALEQQLRTAAGL